MRTADRRTPSLKLNAAAGRKTSIVPVVADQLLAEQDPFDDPFGDLEQTRDRPLSIIEWYVVFFHCDHWHTTST